MHECLRLRVLGHPGVHLHVVGDVLAMMSDRDGPASAEVFSWDVCRDVLAYITADIHHAPHRAC